MNSTPAFGSDDAVEHSSKDGGDFDFDGLLLRISGVRLREAQTEKVQVCLASSFQWFLKLGRSRFLFTKTPKLRGALKPEEVGFEAARVTDGFKAYAVDFEVLRLADACLKTSTRQCLLPFVIDVVVCNCCALMPDILQTLDDFRF